MAPYRPFKPFRTLILSTLALALCGGALQADPAADALATAERQSPPEAVQTLLAADKASPNRADLLAQLALSWCDCVDLHQKKRERPAAEEAAKNAEAAAERAIKADPNLAKAHLALAVACGKKTDFADNSTKMALSKRIREEAERAIALDPKNSVAYEILGRWKVGIATLNPMLRMAARMTYGALPAVTLEEAARDLEQAAALAPKRISPHQQLALLYKTMGQREKSAQQWQIILTLPAKDSDDQAALKQAQKEIRAAGR